MRKPQLTLVDELMASPTEPLPAPALTLHLAGMYSALRSLERDETPTADDWRALSDCVNLTETLVEQGHVQDSAGLLADAVAALAAAGVRHLKNGANIRLDAAGVQHVRAVLEDYAAAASQLPARVIVRCHRATEKRIFAIRQGRVMRHDVNVVEL